ncbi:MAG: M20/M25/M40 family metallo-hydrolase, partial [Chlamydiia bacterium]|nr:M20/M25/M40 family metallo-hydrolase [Chlamydiia bacterium]
MQPYQPYLDWIEDQAESMVTTLTAWSNVNSGSSNHAGVARMAQLCLDTLRPLGDKAALTPLPPREQVGDTGKVSLMDSPAGVHVTKRRDAPMQVFLGAHLDTVFPLDSPFQEARRKDNNTLHGPGVADIKGGIVVLCTALEALERSPFAQNIGWEVFLNPDEEIGSPGSHDFLFDCGKRNQLGLIFEPSLPDGTLVSARKGSA